MEPFSREKNPRASKTNSKYSPPSSLSSHDPVFVFLFLFPDLCLYPPLLLLFIIRLLLVFPLSLPLPFFQLLQSPPFPSRLQIDFPFHFNPPLYQYLVIKKPSGAIIFRSYYIVIVIDIYHIVYIIYINILVSPTPTHPPSFFYCYCYYYYNLLYRFLLLLLLISFFFYIALTQVIDYSLKSGSYIKEFLLYTHKRTHNYGRGQSYTEQKKMLLVRAKVGEIYIYRICGGGS